MTAQPDPLAVDGDGPTFDVLVIAQALTDYARAVIARREVAPPQGFEPLDDWTADDAREFLDAIGETP